MQTYIVLAKLTEKGVQTIKNAPQRIEQSAKDIKAMGGKMVGFYSVMGEYDYVAIFEAPSDEDIMHFLMQVGIAGSVRTTTLRAFDREKLAAIVKKLT
jgi:uncharacterized protein with GYD domain